MRTCPRHSRIERQVSAASLRRSVTALVVALLALAWLFAGGGGTAWAQGGPEDPGTGLGVTDPADPATSTPLLPPPTDGGTILGDDAFPAVEPPGGIDDIRVGVDDGSTDGATQPLTIVALLTVLALAPTMLILMTSFTRIIIVLGITRNALSLPGVPPNQVLIGLALFLTIFVMAPVLSEVNEEALRPLLDGEISQSEAFEVGIEPFRQFMLGQVREEDLAMFVELSGDERPATPDDVATSALVPAFVLSELRAAFIIGFLIFVPFLVIDIVVAATVMSMGMVMLPPVVISLPFKLLLFVVVDGWSLLVPTLVGSFAT